MKKTQWYQNSYRRNCIDMHINDWDERFLSEFDPKKYVDMLVLSRVNSTVVYTHSHTGLCNFPTKVGQMHRGLKGRDIFAEVIDGCHRHKIAVQAYYSVIFDRWAYDTHPDWQMRNSEGKGAADMSRHGFCCVNSSYRDYVAAIAEELCKNYDFEGIRFDMTFWPTVCYCPHCQQRFAKEVGGELPKVVNWENPQWVAFQRKREEWLTEFAAFQTSAVKKVKPEVTVEHQASTYFLPWEFGVTYKLAQQNDFLQGDFYGDALQGSFARKLFYNLSENLPFGFETSICVNMGNHTAMKPKELLRAKAFAAIADGGAFVFIDAIDPVGTLNPAVYRRMQDVFEETKPYEPFLGGEMVQDVAVYLSTESKFDFAENGKSVTTVLTLPWSMPHVDGAVSAVKTLIDCHVPYAVITKRKIAELSRYKLLVLPDVLMMDGEETEAVRQYVKNGGNLYASKHTSLVTKDGSRKTDFMLADVFGVRYIGETKENFTYIAPADGHDDLFSGYTRKHPLGMPTTQMCVEALPGAEVLGILTLPYTDPAEPRVFASIHSNPPGISTGHPAVVFNSFGKGRVIYAAGAIENCDFHRDTFRNLIKLLAGSFFIEAVAPASVEITVFHQKTRQRYIINLVNFQKDLPNIPVDGIKIRMKLNHRDVKRLVVLPTGKELDFKIKNDYVTFKIPRLETFIMLALDYHRIFIPSG